MLDHSGQLIYCLTKSFIMYKKLLRTAGAYFATALMLSTAFSPATANSRWQPLEEVPETNIGFNGTFNLLTPVNGSDLDLRTGNPDTELTITWEDEIAAESYDWHVGLENADFSDPLQILATIPAGTTPELTLPYGAIDALLAENGIAFNGTANLSWTVTANLPDDVVEFAEMPFNVSITRFGSFDLLTPPNGEAVDLNDFDADEITITWEELDGTTEYVWHVGLRDADFTDEEQILLSISAGADTELVLTAGALDAALADLEIAAGATAELSWTVTAEDADEVITFANEAFDIDITRFEATTGFNLLTPPNGEAVDLNDFDAADEITITWEELDGTTEYVWHVGLRDADFTDEEQILLSISAGADTQLVLTAGALDAALADLEIAAGATAELSWTVTAEDADEVITFANEAFDIDITRFEATTGFNLLTPPNGEAVDLNDFDAADEITITWEELDGTTEYVWHVGLRDADFTDEEQILLSISAGADTELVLTAGALDAALADLEIAAGATAELSWTVTAEDADEVITFANEAFDIDITRFEATTGFNLLTPPNGEAVDLNDFDAADEITITWEELDGTTEYVWHVGLRDADFTDEEQILLSISAGADTELVLTAGALDAALADLEIAAGATAELSWTVTAEDADEVITFANEAFDIDITRFEATTGFNLLTPPNGEAVDLNDFDAADEIIITWEELDGTTEYLWHVGLRDADFTDEEQILLSISAGADTELVLTAGALDAALADLEIAAGATAELSWTVTAEDADEVITFANEAFDIDITRFEATTGFNLLTPPNGEAVDLNDFDAADEITITWEELDGTTEYVWHVGLRDADFTDEEQILLSISAGADTQLVLTAGALDAALADLEIAAGATAELSWTVTAEDADEVITFANEAFDIDITRFEATTGFNLLTPPNGEAVDLNDFDAADEITITWEELDGTTEYVWHVGLRDADFTDEEQILLSISAGADTELVLTAGALDAALADLEIAAGATAELSWTVTAEDADEVITFANEAFDIDITRFAALSEAVTLPFFEGFEDEEFPPFGWSIENILGANTWVRSTAQANSGAASAFVTWNGTGGEDFLITPEINPEGEAAIFSFSIRKQFATAFEPDSLIVLISTTGGNSTDFSERLFAIDVANLPANTWNDYSVILNDYTDDNYWIAFQHKNTNGNGVWLDDVSLSIPTFSLLTPEDGTAVDLNDLEPADEITITWEEFDGTTEYVWHAGLAGADFTDAEQILLSIPAGDTPSLTLTAEAIDDALASLEIEAGATVPLSWTVTAEDADENITFANETFDITITRFGVAFCDQSFELPFIETIEEDSETLSCFGVSSTGTNWQILTDVGGWSNSDRSFRFPFYNAAAGTIANLFTPAFEATTEGATVRFDHAHATFQTEVDVLRIFAEVEGEEDPQLVIILEGGIDGPLTTAAPSGPAFVPTRSQWGVAEIELPVGTTRVIFSALSDFGNHLYIDNIAIGNEVIVGSFDLVSPGNNTFVDLGTAAPETEVEVSWTALEGATEYVWQLVALDGEFVEPFVLDVTTTATSFTTTFGDLDALLASLELEAEDEVSTEWRVVATDANGDIIPSNQVFRLDLQRSPVSVVELSNNEILKVYPNPTSGEFILEATTDKTVRQIEVINQMGQVVDVKSINRPMTGIETFNLNKHANGIYFVRLVFDQSISTLKVVKQ
jgi:hypothetical protein